ncbi:MAG TPA: hypothetical protein VM513_04570 [Kofleriaceae bacterium]|jgi:hypothetical protein|nr:hypothetical protein [Kofleriaceae bacterium]
MKTVIVVRTSDPHRQSEALRAALGVTLRGAAIEVVIDEPPHTPLAQRATDTLRAFGHAVGPADDMGEKLARADVVEVWTMTTAPTTSPTSTSPIRGASPPRPRGRILHLVRSEPPVGAVAEGDWVVYLDAMRLAGSGRPPLPAGPIDHDQLVQLSFAADLVVTW